MEELKRRIDSGEYGNHRHPVASPSPPRGVLKDQCAGCRLLSFHSFQPQHGLHKQSGKSARLFDPFANIFYLAGTMWVEKFINM
ncbi:MAG: hypothetical protein LUG45_06480 [Clostridiales bacterium]|nr:hypothetical protein [Clostridiales bacterium]